MPSTTDPLVLHRRGPLQGMRGCAVFVVAIVAVLATPRLAGATSITVPDHVPTVQVALDAGVDTAFVRAGVYAETPTMAHPVTVIGLPGDADHPRPVLAGLILDTHDDVGVQVGIVNLECIARVEVRSANGAFPSLLFENCRLRAGFFEAAQEPMGGQRLFRRCQIDGTVLYADGGSLIIDSCEVTAGQILGGQSDLQLVVTDSRFRGPGQGVAIASVNDIATATISGNVIEEYSAGILLETILGMVVRNNHLTNCRTGISVHDLDSDVTVVHNRVERCGARYAYAIHAESNSRLVVEDNVVLNSGYGGIFALISGSGSITRNLVSGSVADGIYIAGSDPAEVVVSNNTSAYNRGSGFLSESSTWQGPYTFTGNVGVGNGAHGIRWGVPEVTTFRFNNWFHNALGDVQGLPPSSQDLTVDPLFCDAENGDLQLSAASPLADVAGYGRVGALGIGCFAPGVREDAFRMTRVGPNPSGGPVTIDFEMPRAATIEVDVFDIQGRLVASPARGSWPAGRHSVSWARTSAGAPIRPGLYLVRYRFPGGEAQRRIVRTP